jgi:predicted nucleotidyltransferase
MTAQFDNALATAAITDRDRRVLERFVEALEDKLGDDLLAVWLYGSRARGEQPHAESDVDLMVIAEGGERRYGAKVNDLRYDIAWAEGANPVYFSAFVHDLEWLRGRREIESFFIQEVDRDKIVLAGSAL